MYKFSELIQETFNKKLLYKQYYSQYLGFKGLSLRKPLYKDLTIYIESANIITVSTRFQACTNGILYV